MLRIGMPPGQGQRQVEGFIKRCAIYARKSSAEGLEQPVNSLDAQRGACENYILSQSGEGWVALETRYADGGFSGASLDRPAIQRLLADVEAGAIDVVVVYKIDRLSRSLIDFAALLGRFEQNGVSFVAVTQAFNTTTSMGRLTLNVLLSFSQFERELLSERVRDKFAAMRAQGLWQTGPRPYGYTLRGGVLSVDEAEAEIVRYMHRRYPVLGSARLLARELNARGHTDRRGKPFGPTGVRRLLQNRIYCGDLVHAGRWFLGKHPAIVTETVWQATQEAIASVARRHRPFGRPHVPNPLRKRIFAPDGSLLSLDFVYNRQGRIYRYYMPSGRSRRRAFDNPGSRFRADILDDAILSAIMDFVPLAARAAAHEHRPRLLKSLVRRVDVGSEEFIIALRSGAVVTTPVVGRVRSINRPRGRAQPPPSFVTA